jgi:hypothetical protein
MTKSILVSFAVFTLATSAALAAQHRTHHHHATNANANMAAPSPSPVVSPGGASSGNQEMRMRSLRESGYDPKNDFSSSGAMRDH